MNRAKRRSGMRGAVFDMDGTLTELAPGGYEAYAAAHAVGLAKLLEADPEQMIVAYAQARTMIERNPNAYGWEIGGRIVAPALVDHFVAVGACACAVLRDRGEDPLAWEGRLQQLYGENYLCLATVFRPEMTEVFDELRRRKFPFAVISNSNAAKIGVRFAGAGIEAPPVVGNARKMSLTGEATLFMQGCPRTVYTDRGLYEAALGHFLQEHCLEYVDLHVVGDGLELDGLVPVLNGATFDLLEGPNTPDYEKDWLRADPARGRVITDLRAVLDY